jgi:hypothetical protein
LEKLARVQERIISDFGLEVSKPPRRITYDVFEFDTALRARFPVANTKASIEQFLASRSWPPDVVVRPYRNFLWVHYYSVEYSPSLIARVYTVSFRFDEHDQLVGVRTNNETFYGGAPEGMPKFLLRPSQPVHPTPGSVTPRASEGTSR